MAKKKRRPAKRSGFVQKAVKAGRRAIKQAESRVPTDVRRQLERTIKDGQKTVQTAIRQLEAQVRRTARQADVDTALKRLERLSRQVQDLARGAATAAAPARRRSAGVGRAAKPKPRKRAPAKKTSTAVRKPAATKATPTRRPARKVAARPTPGTPEIRYVPPAPAPGPVPEAVDSEN